MPADRLQRVLLWLLIAAAAVYLLQRVVVIFKLLASPLLLFGLAWLVTLAVRPIVDRMTRVVVPLPRFVRATRLTNARRWQLPRALAVLLVYLVLLALFVTLGLLLAPPLLQQINNLQAIVITAVDEANTWVVHLEQELAQRGWRIDLTSILRPELIGQQATALGGALAQQSLGIASSIASWIIDLVLIAILSFYMTLDGPRLVSRVLALLPVNWRDETRTLLRIVDSTFGGFLRAQVLQALFYGAATATLMMLLGLTDVTLASVLATILVLIPLIGGVFAMIPPLLIALIEAPQSFVFLLIGLLVLQQVLFNVVMPRLMGKIVGLHPLLIFGAILVGTTIAGGWGVLFGIPVAGVVASVLQFVYLRALHQRAPTDRPS